MKQLLNFGLLIAFGCCYLEWPPHNSMFVFEAEFEIFSNTKNWISNVTHPIILIGFIAQLILLFSAIKRNANATLNTIGVLLLAPLVLLFLMVGILSLNVKIALGTIPFLCLVLVYFNLKKNKKTTL